MPPYRDVHADFPEYAPLLECQINNESTKKSPFIIRNIELLEKCKKIVMDPETYDTFKEPWMQKLSGNPEGYIGVFREYNKTFKEKANFDLFDFEEGGASNN